MANYLGGLSSAKGVLAKSKGLYIPAAGTHDCIYIPQNTLLTEVFYRVTTAYATAGGTPTISVGFSGNGETADTDAFIAAGEITPGATGIYRATINVFPGKFFAESGIITATVTGTATAGDGFVYALYHQIW